MKRNASMLLTVCSLAVLLFSACETYQAGVTFEPQSDDTRATGFFLGGDTADGVVETTFLYIPTELSQITDFGRGQLGLDLVFKYPFYFANNRIGISPAFGADLRFVNDKVHSFDELFSIGLKVGGGLDLNLTSSLFLRGKAMYVPEILAFMGRTPGLSYGFGLGYRADGINIKKSSGSTQNTKGSTTRIKSQQDNYWDLADSYRKDGKYILAVAEMEKIVEIDPGYRLSANYSYTPSQAAPWGIKTNETIRFSNISIFAMIAFVNFDMVGSGSDPERYVPQADRQKTFEKALSAYQKAYEIDITNRGNNNRNLQSIYLGGIAVTLDRLGRTDEANTYYTQLSRIATVTDPIARRIGIAPTNVANTTPSQRSTQIDSRAVHVLTYEVAGNNLLSQVGLGVATISDGVNLKLYKNGTTSLIPANIVKEIDLKDTPGIIAEGLNFSSFCFTVIVDGKKLPGAIGFFELKNSILEISVFGEEGQSAYQIRLDLHSN